MKLSLKSTLTAAEIFSLYQEDRYAFPISKYICINQIKEAACTYIPLFDNVDSVLAIKCLTQRKSILVVEKLKDNNCSLSIYSIKGERKTLKLGLQLTEAQLILSENDMNTIHCALFFNEGVKLLQVDLAKMKIIAQAFLAENINQLQVSPLQRDVISLCGNGFLRLYTVNNEGYQYTLDLLKKPEGKQFITHIWFDSIIMIACTLNQIYYYRDNELLQIVPNPFPSSIRSICKLGRYFIIATQNEVGIFSRVDDDVQLFEEHKILGNIERMQVNYQEDSIILKLSNLGLAFSYVKINPFEQENERSCILKWIYRPKISNFSADNVSICENKSLALVVHREQQTIEIWNLETGICILKKQFVKSEDNSSLTTGSIHPSGYSIALAFGDRIRLYHLTVEDITLYQEMSCKRIRYLKFSNGGHLLSYIAGRSKNSSVGIINIFTGQEVMNTKINTDLQQLSWSLSDDQLAAAGEANIYIWKGGLGFKEREDIYLRQKITSICFDYKSGRLLASASGELLQIQSAAKTNKIQIQIPKFHSLISNCNKYVATDSFGAIYVDTDLSFRSAERITVSLGKAELLNCLANIVYLNEAENEFTILRSREESKVKYQDFTLITRTEIVKNREKLKTLEQLIETYQTELVARLERQRIKFKEVKSIDEKGFSKQALRLQQQFTELTNEKLHIQKVSGHLFKTVEEKQLKAVETLEVLYEQKLAMERRKIMDLQQKILEQNVNFQKSMEAMKRNHKQEVTDLKRQIANKSNTAYMQTRIKERQSQLNLEHELRLEELEFQNQTYTDEIQFKANSSISDLYSEIALLKRKYNSNQVEHETMRLELERLREETKIKESSLEVAQAKIIENKNKIASLEKEVLWKDDLIKDKENKLYEYEYKISDLEKAKEVMSFRTTEIWRELEPKQSEVDRLKKKLSKLETEFKQAEKESKNTLQKVIKKENLIVHLKKSVLDVKSQLKMKSNQYDELALQIHRLVNDVDPRLRGSEILKVYQEYVRFKRPQKDHQPQNQKIQQLNRHVIHAQESLYQMNISKKKQMKIKEQESVWKMKQNAELISDINDLRKQYRNLKTSIKQKDTELASLRRQLNAALQASSKKAISEHTGVLSSVTGTGASSRKRNIKSSQIPLRQVDSLQTSFRMDHKHDYSTMRTRQTRIMSANKTAIVHRAMNESHVEKTQNNQALQELEIANRRIQQQERIIDELNRRLLNYSNQS